MSPSVVDRFARNAVRHGGNPKPKRGFPYPTHAEMDELERHNLPFDVDVKLRKPLVEINRAGYKTWGSCSGHATESSSGWVHVAPARSDPFLVNLKEKHSDIHSCIKPELECKKYGYSRVQVDPGRVKTIIKRYTDADNVNYRKPIIDRPLHHFSFRTLSDEDW